MNSNLLKTVSVDGKPRFRDREAPGSNPGPPTTFECKPRCCVRIHDDYKSPSAGSHDECRAFRTSRSSLERAITSAPPS